MREHLFPAIPRPLKAATILSAAALLSSCSRAVLDPAGDIAVQQRDIIYISTALMLLIIVPVMALIVVFAWRYRKGKGATYDPKFDHSTALELVIWSAPLLIIICLGALTWWSTHLLDPFRPLNRVSATKAVDPNVKPLVIQVVSLDWKWLFIYPEQGVATVNELVMPVDRPVRFDLTSTNMMNTFYAPTLAGMIYTMPGMRSTLHAVINREGTYDGLSANYSGAGFSHMRFKLHGVKDAGFESWVAGVRARGSALDVDNYLKLEKPSQRVPVMRFAQVEPELFRRILQRCVKPGTPCMTGMHGSQPEEGKPEGAVFKEGHEKGGGESLTPQPGAQSPPPAAGQHHDHHSSLNLIDAAPGTARVAAA
ncbi:ubiquinol oxidase subunit II [Sphingomonas crocodyli]|uniref:Ubiquinol oxidase subunit 2 n=1 Tax=Sphingomonas crocodyli TaxID=1979270 RepID=A0A437M5V1_9SPHN|nr:ubiquinol oxidase subunit II [Sphingomonas crocodyli]RVT93052.1 ubiquinol oxidase subunit II [Sphingomonas crocodyli]